MQPKTRLDKIRKILKKRYPEVKPQLVYADAFQLLVATILSAQCTDRQVNAVTARLFRELATPEDFSRATLSRIEALIRSTGFYRNKARHIKGCAQALLRTHAGQVPQTLEHLVRLPGVGRKTANVVLGAAFGIPGLVVDTHVARIAGRLEITGHTDPVKIECDLMGLVPRREWSDFSLRLIYFGRDVCRARRPLCAECPIGPLCPYPASAQSTAARA
jgi:endonuclease-3